MKPAAFELLLPTSVEEALDLLERHGDEAKLLSGGQSLVPTINMRLATPAYLIDLNQVNGLDYIRKERDSIAIGARSRHHSLETSRMLRDECPLLAEAAASIGHLAIRYRGTIGGSLAHADPAATLPVALLTLDGTVQAVSKEGVRDIDAKDFFVGIFTTDLQPDEILVEVRVPCLSRTMGYSFLTLTRRHGDFPLVVVGCTVSLSDGKLDDVRLTVGGVNPVPERITAAETFLRHQVPGPDIFVRAAELAQQQMEAETDLHATAAYRTQMVGLYIQDALAQAVESCERRVTDEFAEH